MRFGINTFLFTSPFTNESTGLFKTIKKFGFDTVELAIEDPSHIDPLFIKKELDRHKLVCGSMCAALGPDRDLRGNPEQQHNAMDYFMRLMDQMEVLECKTLMGPVYSAVGRAEYVPDKEKKSQWKLVVSNLKKVCRHAEKHDMVIAMEPLNRFETDFINTVDQALVMIKDVNSPALRLLLDTFHMNIEEKDPVKAILKAGNRLAHFHASGSDRGCPCHDHIDWKAIGKALHKIHYHGDVVIESFTQDIKIIAKAAAIWRDIEPSQMDIATKGLKFLKKAFK